MQCYVWENKKEFVSWYESLGAFIAYDLREEDGKWQALLDGHGVKKPSWHDIPDAVVPGLIWRIGQPKPVLEKEG